MSYLQALNAGLINPTNQIATYTYNELSYPVASPTSIGYQYFEGDATGWDLDVTTSTWTGLFADQIEYPAGIYMLSATFAYRTSGTAEVVEDGQFFIGLADSLLDLDPNQGYFCGSSTNEGVLSLSVPFISDGNTKNTVIFVYNINFANSEVTDIAYSLTRIG